MVPPN